MGGKRCVLPQPFGIEPVHEHEANRWHALAIGGGMANTFFKAQGYSLGKSLTENDALDTAKNLLERGGDNPGRQQRTE